VGAAQERAAPTRTPADDDLGVVAATTPTPSRSRRKLTYGIEADTAGGYCLFKAQLAIGGIQVRARSTTR